jgi:hypothetical protein
MGRSFGKDANSTRRRLAARWCGCSSRASVLVNPSTPILDTKYGMAPRSTACHGRSATYEETLMMWPFRRFSVWGEKALVRRVVPLRLTPGARSQRFIGVSVNGALRHTAALLTRTSMRPNLATVRCASASTSSSRLMSQGTAKAQQSRSWIWRATSPIVPGRPEGAASVERPTQSTWAPPWARAIAVARPMPREAPGTTATASRNSILCQSPAPRMMAASRRLVYVVVTVHLPVPRPTTCARTLPSLPAVREDCCHPGHARPLDSTA